MKILLPIDGSTYCQNAIQSAVETVRVLGGKSTVVLVNVVSPLAEEATTDMANIDVLDSSFADALLSQYYGAESQELFKKVKVAFNGLDCNVEEVTLVGHAATRIAEVADKLDVDLIMMGSHGQSGLSTMVFGSVTEGVLTRTNKPVLIARTKPFTSRSGANIAMAVDVKGDDATMAKFVVANREFFGENAQFAFVHVLGQIGDPLGLINPLKETFDAVGVTPADVSLVGDPAEQLTQYVEDKKPDLIVMGSRGYRWMDPRVLGSVTLKVIDKTRAPILIVHPVKE